MGPFWGSDLTSEQIAQMQEIHAEWLEIIQPPMQQVWQAREGLADMHSSGNRDAAEIAKIFSQFADLQCSAIETRLDTRNRLEALLTPEQKQWVQQEWVALSTR